jgi:hypothetical protein
MEEVSPAIPGEKWYIRTADGAMYGPATPLELVGWAAEARIVPGCQISSDGLHWEPAEAMPRLRMDWVVELGPEDQIGPLNLLAVGDLVREGTIPLGAVLTCPGRQIRTTIDHHFFALLLQESRENLALAAGEEHRLLRQLTEDWIPAALQPVAAELQALRQTLETERADGEMARQVWESDRARLQKEGEEARCRAQQAEESGVRAERQWRDRLGQAEGEIRRQALQGEAEREEFARVRQGLIGELDQVKTRLAELQGVHEAAQRELDQFRAEQGAERRRHLEVEQRYQAELSALRSERDDVLQSRSLLAATVASAEKEHAALREELNALRQREAQVRIELAERVQAAGEQARLIEQGRGAVEAQTRIADELRAQLAHQTQSNAKLAEELSQTHRESPDLTPGPADTLLLDESELLAQECAHLAELLDHWPQEKTAHPVAEPVSAIDWIDPRPAITPVPAPLSPATPVSLRIQGAVKVLRQAEKELAKQRQLYHDSIRRGADREAELTALVDQLRRDLEMSSRLVSQSMEEIEKREGELRQLRRGGTTVEPPPAAPPLAVAVEPEVLPPENRPVPPKKLARDVPLRSPPGVLAGLEKQAPGRFASVAKKASTGGIRSRCGGPPQKVDFTRPMKNDTPPFSRRSRRSVGSAPAPGRGTLPLVPPVIRNRSGPDSPLR